MSSQRNDTRAEQGDRDAAQEDLAIPHLITRTRSERIKAEGKIFLKFLFLSTYVVLATIGLGYGIYLGGEPPLDPSPAFYYTVFGVASLWILGVTTAWLLMNEPCTTCAERAKDQGASSS